MSGCMVCMSNEHPCECDLKRHKKIAQSNFDMLQENKLSGGVSNWYTLDVLSTQGKDNYTAVCDDIILALNMTFQEGEVFKATWRKAAARLGNGKPGNTALYNAQKVTHYGKIMELEENHLINKGNTNEKVSS